MSNEKAKKSFFDFIRTRKSKAQAAMLGAGAIVKAESVKRAPLLYGPLRASHYFKKVPSLNPNVVTVEVGATVHYAAVQHETLGFEHRVGEAKFLTKAVAHTEQEVIAFLKRELGV